MNLKNLLFVFLILVPIIHIKCQDGDVAEEGPKAEGEAAEVVAEEGRAEGGDGQVGGEEVKAEGGDGESDEGESGETEEVEGGKDGEGEASKAEEVEPIKEEEDENAKDLWPDLSCHPKFTRKSQPQTNERTRGWKGRRRSKQMVQEDSLGKMNKFCNELKPTGAKGWRRDLLPDEYRGTCPKHCMLARLGFLKTSGIFSKKAILTTPAMSLRHLVGSDLGTELSNNVYSSCFELFKDVFKGDKSKNPCENERVNEIYDCVNKALKCWNPE